MATRTEAIAAILVSVKAMCGIDGNGSDSRINAFAGHYYDTAAGITGYVELPDALLPFVQDATVKAWRRRGAEASTSYSAIGVSEHYVDIDDNLRKSLRWKRNPFASIPVSDTEQAGTGE